MADHTVALARALAALGAGVLVIGDRGDPARIAPVTCRAGVAVPDLPAAAADLGAGVLVLQYVPFLYARSGLSPALLRAAAAVRARGLGLVVIVHEPFVPFTRVPWLVTGLPMRWQLHRLVREATRVLTPVPRWAERLRGWARSPELVEVAPIGATLPVSRLDRDAARRALGVRGDAVAIGIFSPAASGFRGDWVRAAVARVGAGTARAEVVWILFGRGGDRFLADLAGPAILRIETGADPEAPGRVMRALDLALAPYDDGLTFRRTGAMLALAHGVPVASSTGPLFDPAAGALAVCEGSADSFVTRVKLLAADPAGRREAAARAARFSATASIEVLASRLVSEPGAR